MGDLRYLRPTLDARSDLEKAFAPEWNVDVYVLADLWHWLCWQKRQPSDVGYFLTHATDWAEDYARLLKFKGGAL
jgi:hypothetical protein